MEGLTHWDDLPLEHHELGPMNARWRTADGVKLGMSRIDVLPGAQSTPAHQHTAEEELFHVLAYSDIDPNDLAFYPDSSKVKLRGLDVMMRVEPVDYWDGED